MGESESAQNSSECVTPGRSWWSRTVVHLQDPTDLQMSGAPVTHTSPTRDHLHADDENDNMYQTDTLLSPTPSFSTNVGKVCQLSCPGMSSKTRTMRSPVCNPAGPCENDGPDPYSHAIERVYAARCSLVILVHPLPTSIITTESRNSGTWRLQQSGTGRAIWRRCRRSVVSTIYRVRTSLKKPGTPGFFHQTC